MAAVAGLIFAWKDFIRRANDYVLTNHRIIQEIGVLSRRSMDSRLDKINNVEHRQTLWGRLLDYGDVEIDTASETGAALFPQHLPSADFKNAILARGGAVPRRAGRMPLAAPAGPSGAERMRQLKALLDDGLISREEYEAKRRRAALAALSGMKVSRAVGRHKAAGFNPPFITSRWSHFLPRQGEKA